MTYEVSSVGRVFRDLGFSRQMPVRKDHRQKEAEVAKWHTTRLPKIKKTADGTSRVIGYADEATCYVVPSVGLTWARKGQTPMLRDGDRYGHLSVISLITETGDLHDQIQDGSYHREDVARFLRQIRATYPTALTMIGDGAPIHRGEAVNTFLRLESHGVIQLEQLPAYSPELNADEQVWASVKEHEFSNLCCKTCDELTPHVVAAFERLKQQPNLIRSFFKHPQVGFIKN